MSATRGNKMATTPDTTTALEAPKAPEAPKAAPRWPFPAGDPRHRILG